MNHLCLHTCWLADDSSDHLTINHGEDSDEDGSQLTTRFRSLNQLLDGFWRRWRKEYLLKLREAHCDHRGSGKPQLTEEDIVVVYSDDQPQRFWKLGGIEKVLQGANGRQHAATIRVSRNGRTLTLDHPIQHLYPLAVIPCNSTVAEPEDSPEDELRPDSPRSEPKQASISSTRP